MTVQLTLPAEVERRLTEEVNAGRYDSVEEAILARISRNEDPDLIVATSMTSAELRGDLEEAWKNREGAVDGQIVFDRLSARNASVSGQGK